MEKITKNKLKELLEKEKVEVEVAPKDYDDMKDTYELGFNMDFCLSEDGNSEIKYDGFKVETFIGKKPIAKNFKTLTKLFAYLEKEKVFDGDDVIAVSYRSLYPTYQAHLDALAFDCIDMTQILDKYLPYADKFSLTCPFCNDPKSTKQYGTYKLTKSQADYAYTKVRETLIGQLNRIFGKIVEDKKENLPSFDVLINNIENEIKEYKAKYKKEVGKNDGETFFCDKFSMGETKYCAPQELWHFYHNIENISMFRWLSDKMQQNKKENPLDAELDDEYYVTLKSDVQDIEVTYCWHCTISSQLSKVFYFRLSDNSIAWLRKLQNDYDMKKLDDLAFYKGEKVLFSSCTHENFHTDCMQEK